MTYLYLDRSTISKYELQLKAANCRVYLTRSVKGNPSKKEIQETGILEIDASNTPSIANTKHSLTPS